MMWMNLELFCRYDLCLIWILETVMLSIILKHFYFVPNFRCFLLIRFLLTYFLLNFFQYADQSITAKACAGLNGMKLGGQTLTVIQATTNKPLSVCCLSLLFNHVKSVFVIYRLNCSLRNDASL